MSQAFNPYNHNNTTVATASNAEDDNISMQDSPCSKTSDSEESKQADSSDKAGEENNDSKQHENNEEEINFEETESQFQIPPPSAKTSRKKLSGTMINLTSSGLCCGYRSRRTQ